MPPTKITAFFEKKRALGRKGRNRGGGGKGKRKLTEAEQYQQLEAAVRDVIDGESACA